MPDARAVRVLPQFQKSGQQKSLVSVGADVAEPLATKRQQSVNVLLRSLGDCEGERGQAGPRPSVLSQASASSTSMYWPASKSSKPS